MRNLTLKFCLLLTLAGLALTAPLAAAESPGKSAEPQWVTYEGATGERSSGIGQGRHVVLISGDDEYRSEEALPQLGKILAAHHGFKCTVLFAIDPADGTIKPDYQKNIPGLEALQTADLMVLFTRFRNLPPEQMQHVVDYVKAGKPIVAMRTATHAFNFPADSPFAKYSWNSKVEGNEGGFGRQILGETWLSHHGHHGHEATRGVLVPEMQAHPILQGIKNGDIFGPTDVYGVRLPLPDGSQPLVLGEIVAGMKADDPALEGDKNNPMMPVAWVKSYKTEEGQTGRVFTTTMGASQDLLSEGVRRLLVNACLWAVGMEDQVTPTLAVDVVGDYQPTRFSFGGHVKGVKPADLQWRP